MTAAPEARPGQPDAPPPGTIPPAPAAQPATAPADTARSRGRTYPGLLADRATLLLGVALALATIDPTQSAARGLIGWLSIVAAVIAALWAAPAVTQRPTAPSVDWVKQLTRHRNTVFAATCAVVAGFGSPPVWLAAVDATLLTAYLLAVDAFAAGPIGVRQLRRRTTPLAAAAAAAAALVAAHAPIAPGEIWGRIVAALAVAVAAAAIGVALWIRRSADRRPGPRRSATPAARDTGDRRP